MSDLQQKPDPGARPSQAVKPGPSPVLWVLVGVAVAMAVVVTSRLVDRAEPAAAPASAAPSRLPVLPGPAEPLGSSRARFAELYVNYLLRTYYVPRRGFCKALLEKICRALVNSDLLLREDTCRTVPNDAFVLAIGRYQHRVGLPVDGKAGPETVRMMLGGDFSNRRGMASTYCGVVLPEDDPAGNADGDR